MSLKIGIVGLPNVGKSTLFNALTKKSVPALNFPFCTIDPSVGVVVVPDERLGRLGIFSKSKKTIPAVVEFVDIAGLVAGASEGEGLGNQFLAHIREVDVIAHVIRFFDDPDITHVHGEVNPLEDINVINLELVMADLQTVAKRLNSIDKEIRTGEKDVEIEKSLLIRLEQHLKAGESVRYIVQNDLSQMEEIILKGLHLLTFKPMLFVLNKKSGGHNIDELNDERYERCKEYLEGLGAVVVIVDAGIENELSEIADDERENFRQELGAVDDGVDTLIQKGFELLNLITFFTTGEDETRGWMIVKDSTAPEAGAAIHTDFQTKFIRADVIMWNTLLEVGSYAAAREKGLIKTVGKDYIVEDGEVIEFKI